MNSFAEFDLPAEILEALAAMKYETPTPVQAQAIPAALRGRDLIASAQTGTGKTAAFGIPLLVQLLTYPQARALILAPTRELAGQIVAVLRQLSAKTRGVEITLIIGGVGMQAQDRALSRKPQIIVATPGRLVDHLRSKRNLLAGVSFLVLDEADRMLDLGFAPQLRIIREAIKWERQTMLFSATFPTDIEQLAKQWLTEPERVSIGSVSKPVDRINQSTLSVAPDDKNGATLQELANREGSVLIFTRTKRRTDRLTQFLQRNGIAACRLHGDRSQNQRDEALLGFRNGRFRVLVATDIAARGIDVPHIEHVINYDLPMVAEDYLHRIGRTGRAGRSGEAICLVSPEERPLWRAIERLIASTQGLSSQESRSLSQESRAATRDRGAPGRGGQNGQNRQGGGRRDSLHGHSSQGNRNGSNRPRNNGANGGGRHSEQSERSTSGERPQHGQGGMSSAGDSGSAQPRRGRRRRSRRGNSAGVIQAYA